MGLPLSGAVQWWGEWQLHVLALGSLGLQYALGIFAIFRKPGAPPWVRFFTWLAFLGSDAVAIYALATLFNRQRYTQLPGSVSEHDRHGLQVLWAPILLMHLGGQAGITAYNIEDNELWRRYIVTALSQVMVVLWVLYKSWGSPLKTKRFQVVVILLFIGGISKCFQKPWSLKNASFSSLANSCDQSQRTTSREEDLEKYVLEARVFVLSEEHSPRSYNMAYIYKPVMLFLDLAHPYPDRLTNLKYFFVWGNAKDYIELKSILSNIFEVLYIREDMTNYKECSCGWLCGTFTLALCFYTLIVGFFLTPISAKNRVDGIVTAVLLFGTAVLEILAPKINDWYGKIKWPDTMAQHSLIGYFARSRRHTMLMRFARFFQCKDLLDQNWSMKPSYASVHITKLVHQHIRDGWEEYIKDAESYREFNDIRGQWTLVRESCDESLGWSLEKPFDESVLLWHIATDLCFHQMDTSLGRDCAYRSRQISNYMMHLLFLNPEMLMPGSRSNLFKTACRELRDILKGEGTSRQEKRLVQKTIDKLKSNDDAKETFIHDAWLLAQGLMEIGDESKTWKVIKAVWLEMLCFSAGRCRGYLHAKSLGTGVEYLSYVWLLLAHMGMETFSERIQRSMSINLLKQRTEHLPNTGSDSNTLSVSPDEGSVTFDEIVVLP